MNREQLGELISAYLDDALEPRERQQVERLLQSDRAARQLHDELRRTVVTLQSLPRHSAPAAILQDVQAQLERSLLLDDVDSSVRRPRAGRISWFGRMAVAAMLGIVAYAGWWFVAPDRGRMPPQPDSMAARTTTPDRDLPASVESDEIGRAAGLHSTVALASLSEKIDAGASLEEIRSHSFANEALRIQLDVPDPFEQSALVSRVSRRLAETQAIRLESAEDGSRETLQPATAGSFFFEGQAGVNFAKEGTRQLIVRATPRQVGAILDELEHSSVTEDRVQLQAGALAVQGVRKTRGVFDVLLNGQEGHGSQEDLKDSDRVDRLASGESVSARKGRAGLKKKTSPTLSDSDTHLLGDFLRSLGMEPGRFFDDRTNTMAAAASPVEAEQDRGASGGGIGSMMVDAAARLDQPPPSATGAPVEAKAESETASSADDAGRLVERSRRLLERDSNATDARAPDAGASTVVSNQEMAVAAPPEENATVAAVSPFIYFVIEVAVQSPAGPDSGRGAARTNTTQPPAKPHAPPAKKNKS